MKKVFVLLSLVMLACMGNSLTTLAKTKPGSADLRVILIRHGEKPAQGDNLSCAGFNRSIKLVTVLKTKFGVPDNIYVPAPSTGKQTQNCRMLQTIMPFAIKYNLAINTSCAVTESDILAKKIKKQVGTVFVVWEHKELKAIVTALGVKSADKWADDDYDTIYIITYHKGKASLTRDHEGITPSADCSF